MQTPKRDGALSGARGFKSGSAPPARQKSVARFLTSAAHPRPHPGRSHCQCHPGDCHRASVALPHDRPRFLMALAFFARPLFSLHAQQAHLNEDRLRSPRDPIAIT
jgi:hypothetical protein